MSRFTVNPKNKSLDDIGVVILCAGKGPLYLVDNISLLKNISPSMDITIVIGNSDVDSFGAFNYNYLTKNRDVRLVINENAAMTGPARSALLGMQVVLKPNILIAYGDTKLSAKHLTATTSHVTIGNARSSVGVMMDGNHVSHLEYGLETKWGQTLFLKGPDVDKFYKNYNNSLLMHEIINKCIEDGLKLEGIKV